MKTVSGIFVLPLMMPEYHIKILLVYVVVCSLFVSVEHEAYLLLLEGFKRVFSLTVNIYEG